MSEQTNLREARAELNVEGILAEKKLEEVMVDGKKVIRGDLVIQTSENNFVTFNMYVNELKKDNTPSGLYAGAQTIMNEYKSVAKDGRDEADYVRVSKGKIRPNTYFDQRGKHDVVRYSSNFFNRFSPDEDFEPKAEFAMEVFIVSITPEMGKNEDGVMVETGRQIVKGWLPTYNGIEPVVLIAPTDDGIADAIADSYEPGMTVEFYGDAVNTKMVTVREIPLKIGKPRREETVTYKNELVITGASEPYEAEEGDMKPYDADAISKAVADRELILAEKERKAKEGNSGNTSTGSKPASSGRKLPLF